MFLTRSVGSAGMLRWVWRSRYRALRKSGYMVRRNQWLYGVYACMWVWVYVDAWKLSICRCCVLPSWYNNWMKRSRSRKGRSSQVPLFISKLLQMVQNAQIVDVIGWTSSGDSFNIKNISRFTEQVLPRYFKHRNFSSFIRQLNMYGFRKTRHPDGQNVYMHEHFRAGARAQLRHINRKMREDRDDRLVLHQGGMRGDGGRQIQELKAKQKNLEQMCRHFFIQNQKLMQENQNIIRRMEREAKEKEKRLEEFLIALAQKALPPHDPAPLALANHPHDPNQDNDHWQRVRSLLERIYCSDLPKQESPREEKPQGEGDHEDSYMSINDFINADDYENSLNLEDSR